MDYYTAQREWRDAEADMRGTAAYLAEEAIAGRTPDPVIVEKYRERQAIEAAKWNAYMDVAGYPEGKE